MGKADGGADDVGFLTLLQEDLRVHWNELTRPGFQALMVHRISRRAGRCSSPAFASLLKAISRSLARLVRYRFGIDLDARARLGRRLSIGHQGGIFVGPDVTIGDDCSLLQGARIGCRANERETTPGPRIGHDVQIGARATVRGDIRIGDGVRIGPNAVVTTDVEPGAAAIARPSKTRRHAPPTGADPSSDRPVVD